MSSDPSRAPAFGEAFTESELRVLDQYLTRYAEPEARYGAKLSDRYGASVVLPLCDEDPPRIGRMLSVIEGDIASEPAASEVACLVILVVNARKDAPPEVLAQNTALLEAVRARARRRRLLSLPREASAERAPADAELLELGGERLLHVLLLDASSPGHRFPPRQGVGLARRIGCDVALALARSGKLTSRYIGSTDGDVELPTGYLAALASRRRASALLFPFRHVSTGDERVHTATCLAELSWRYYVLGLAFAGSPFAYHSLGSSLAVEVLAYAQVRGFPRREAAEDFHLLAKLVKIAEIRALPGPVLQIASRRSERVPFGTGPRVGALLARAASPEDAFTLHDPRVFEGLRWLVARLRQLARGGECPAVPAALPSSLQSFLVGRAEQLRAAIEPKLAHFPSPRHRVRRVFEAFDALATLRLVHALRDAGLPPVPWREAVIGAPFLAAPPEASLMRVLERARALEAAQNELRGLIEPPGDVSSV